MRYMRIGCRESVVFAIGHLNSSRLKIDRRSFCSFFRIGELTLNRRLNELRKSGIIYRDGGILGYSLTETGSARFESIKTKVFSLPVTPEHNSVPANTTIGAILPLFKDDLNKLKIVSSRINNDPLDLEALFEDDLSIRPGTREDMLYECHRALSVNIPSSLDDLAKELVLFDISKDMVRDLKTDIKKAEHLSRKGDLKTARAIYDAILLKGSEIDPGIWIMAVSGRIRSIKVLDSKDKALETANAFLDKIEDPGHSAIIKKTKAEILSDLKRYEEAGQILGSCRKTFQNLKLPVLIALTDILSGVNNFRQGMHDLAEKNWKIAKTIGRDYNIQWIIAVADMNLSDCYGLKKKYRRAREILRESRYILASMDDMEGLSGVEFNMALVCIEEGKEKEALYHAGECMRFPLAYQNKIDERKSVLNDRFRKMGWAIPYPKTVL